MVSQRVHVPFARFERQWLAICQLCLVTDVTNISLYLQVNKDLLQALQLTPHLATHEKFIRKVTQPTSGFEARLHLPCSVADHFGRWW